MSKGAARAAKTTLAQRLQEVRSWAGISARQLDSLAGLRWGHVWSFESGRRTNIESKTALPLVGVLGVSLDWLLAGKGPAPTPESVRAAVRAATRAAGRTEAE